MKNLEIICFLIFALIFGACKNSTKVHSKTNKIIKHELSVQIISQEFQTDTLKGAKGKVYNDLKELLLNNADFTGNNNHHSDGIITDSLFDFIYRDKSNFYTPKQKMDMLFLFVICYRRESENYRANLYGKIKHGDTAIINNPVYIIPLVEVGRCSSYWPEFLLSRKEIKTPKVYEAYTKSILIMLNEIPKGYLDDSLLTLQSKLQKEKWHNMKYNPLIFEYLKKKNQ